LAQDQSTRKSASPSLIRSSCRSARSPHPKRAHGAHCNLMDRKVRDVNQAEEGNNSWPSTSQSTMQNCTRINGKIHLLGFQLNQPRTCYTHALKYNYEALCYREPTRQATRSLLDVHRRCTRLRLRLRPHGLYVNLVVRREYSSPDHSGSTSTTPYAAATSSSGCTTTSTTISTSKLVENGFRGINN
jgi:hypothetical protein